MRSGTLLACSALACGAAPQHATYPAWEPTSPVVPVVKSRALAREYLEISRKLWERYEWDDYAFVRAKQVSDEEVQFTLLVVHQDRVVQRALLSTRPDVSGLGDRVAGDHGSEPVLLWWEHGKEVGTHEDGALPLTVDDLYDVCREQVLDVHPELQPRLYFRFDGLLQHCGFLVDECPDCPAASLQSLGKFTPQPWQEPKDGVCNDRPGLFVSGDDAIYSLSACEGCTCRERNREKPTKAQSRKLSLSELEELCTIDDAACLVLERERHPKMGYWDCRMLLLGTCRAGFSPPDPRCTGRAHPLRFDAAWTARCRPEPF